MWITKVYSFAVSLLACLVMLVILSVSTYADPIVQTKHGLVDWCQGFGDDEKAEAICIHGELFALDYEGNLDTDLDGPAPDEGEDA
jgi:hypothetical protein